MQRERRRHLHEQTLLARSADGVQRLRRTGSRGCEPDFASVGGPVQSDDAVPPGRKRPHLAVQVEQLYFSRGITRNRMGRKRDRVSLRRKPQIGDVRRGRVVQRLPDRILDDVAPARGPHDRHLGSVRRPVCGDDAGRELTRQASGQRGTSQCAVHTAESARVQRDRHVAA